MSWPRSDPRVVVLTATANSQQDDREGAFRVDPEIALVAATCVGMALARQDGAAELAELIRRHGLTPADVAEVRRRVGELIDHVDGNLRRATDLLDVATGRTEGAP